MKIYLSDLVYDTVATNYVVPLNCGCLAANLKKKFGNEVSVQIFKYPTELERAIKDSPPDVLGLSNYSWNTRLNALMMHIAKRINPACITVMGGPNARLDDGIAITFLRNPMLDYYVLFEGEDVLCNLVTNIMNGIQSPPDGCACMLGGELCYTAIPLRARSKTIDYPSPYLTGNLDAFLKNSRMIPLLESNRGCPHGCVYCTWGVSALSQLRIRDLDTVIEEMWYVSRVSAGQVNWIFCDANFGILERDVEIVKQIRLIRDKHNHAIQVMLWNSKNTSERNIRIAEILQDSGGYVALQSTDPSVLHNCGRGNFKIQEFKRQVAYYHDRKIPVATDILIGLPGESSQSHHKSLCDTFDIGFDVVSPYNIRLLPGSKYETDEFRSKYGVKTAFRPIFGCYGVYDGVPVLECEESVRGTQDMTEPELEHFKIIHFLIYFCWNIGFGKPLLKFGQAHGVNPMNVLVPVAESENPLLKAVFDEMHRESVSEWFPSEQALIECYQDVESLERLSMSFCKLNSKYIAMLYANREAIEALNDTLCKTLTKYIPQDGDTSAMLSSITDLNALVMCMDFLDPAMQRQEECACSLLPFFLDDPINPHESLAKIVISRPGEYVDFCRFHLAPQGVLDYSIANLARFLEIGGSKMMRNKIERLL